MRLRHFQNSRRARVHDIQRRNTELHGPRIVHCGLPGRTPAPTRLRNNKGVRCLFILTPCVRGMLTLSCLTYKEIDRVSLDPHIPITQRTTSNHFHYPGNGVESTRGENGLSRTSQGKAMGDSRSLFRFSAHRPALHLRRVGWAGTRACIAELEQQ